MWVIGHEGLAKADYTQVYCSSFDKIPPNSDMWTFSLFAQSLLFDLLSTVIPKYFSCWKDILSLLKNHILNNVSVRHHHEVTHFGNWIVAMIKNNL